MTDWIILPLVALGTCPSLVREVLFQEKMDSRFHGNDGQEASSRTYHIGTTTDAVNEFVNTYWNDSQGEPSFRVARRLVPRSLSGFARAEKMDSRFHGNDGQEASSRTYHIGTTTDAVNEFVNTYWNDSQGEPSFRVARRLVPRSLSGFARAEKMDSRFHGNDGQEDSSGIYHIGTTTDSVNELVNTYWNDSQRGPFHVARGLSLKARIVSYSNRNGFRARVRGQVFTGMTVSAALFPCSAGACPPLLV